MQIVKNVICFAVTLIFLVLSVNTPQKAPSSNVKSDYAMEHRYIVDLQERRESCYERILFLGAISEADLEKVKQELRNYLIEIQTIQHESKRAGISDGLFQQSLELDKRLMTNTLDALNSKDERYLESLAELHQQLEAAHLKLRTEYIGE